MIPVSQPDLSGNEQTYVAEAIASSWISSSGKFVDRFEREFAEACGGVTALAVCNGTVALHLALLGLDVRPGDEVLVPSLTFVATANAVRYVGAEPVFIDVDPQTWCINPALLERSITQRSRGIIAVHLYGQPADMDAIRHVAAVHGLWVVEDAAEAHFARYKDKPVGALGRVGTFSFYGNKILTCGEGGAVVINDPALAVRLRTLRGQGMDPARRYYHPVIGYNFRLTNLQCAILCAQIERAGHFMEERNRICRLYREHLHRSSISFQFAPPDTMPAPWMMCIVLRDEEIRDRVASKLAEREVETRPFFVPLHRLPPFRERSALRREDLPHTDRLARTGLCLPTYVGLRDVEVEQISQIVTDVVDS